MRETWRDIVIKEQREKAPVFFVARRRIYFLLVCLLSLRAFLDGPGHLPPSSTPATGPAFLLLFYVLPPLFILVWREKYTTERRTCFTTQYFEYNLTVKILMVRCWNSNSHGIHCRICFFLFIYFFFLVSVVCIVYNTYQWHKLQHLP